MELSCKKKNLKWIFISYSIYGTCCVFYISSPNARGYKTHNLFHKYRMKWNLISDPICTYHKGWACWKNAGLVARVRVCLVVWALFLKIYTHMISTYSHGNSFHRCVSGVYLHVYNMKHACDIPMPLKGNKPKITFLGITLTFKVKRSLTFNNWKGFISGVFMPNIKSLYLIRFKSYGQG